MPGSRSSIMKMLKGHNPSSSGGPGPASAPQERRRRPRAARTGASELPRGDPPKINEGERETLARVRLPAIEGHGVLVAHAAAAKDVQGRADGEIDAALAELGHELQIAE